MARPSPLSRPGPRMQSGLGPPKASDVITFDGHEGVNVDEALDARPPTHVLASTDPTATDDDTDGHVVGCRWINLAGAEEFVAVDVSTGAAVWESTTSGGGGSLTVEDADESYGPVSTLVFADSGDATVEIADDGGGQVTVTVGATGGGGGNLPRRLVCVQDAVGANSNSNSRTITLPSTPTNGNHILLAICMSASSASASSVSSSNTTWTKLADTSTLNPRVELWIGAAAASAGTVITINWSTSAYNSGWAGEVAGLAGTMDASTVSGATTTSHLTGTVTPSSYLPVIAIMGTDNGSTPFSNTATPLVSGIYTEPVAIAVLPVVNNNTRGTVNVGLYKTDQATQVLFGAVGGNHASIIASLD